MLSKLFSLISVDVAKYATIVGFIILAVLVGILLFDRANLKDEINELKIQNSELTQSVENLQTTKKELLLKDQASKQEATNLNELLSKCYAEKSAQDQELIEVDKIMSDTTSTVTAPPVVVKEKPDVITPTQSRQGLDLLNRQFDRLR